MDPYAFSSLGPFHTSPELVATARFTLSNGDTVSFEGVRPDSIGPSGEAPGVVGVEFESSDRVVHIPWVVWWEVSYR